MTVQDGWDALVQLRDTMTSRKRSYVEDRADLDDYQVFEMGRLAGRAFVAKNLESRLVDRAGSRMEDHNADRDGDGWGELEDFQDFVLDNYLRPASPGDIPDFKPGEKGFEVGKADEAQDVSDDIDRVFEFEGPDSDDLAHDNVADPDEDPIITEDGRVLKLGRRDPAKLQDELEDMADQDVIDVDAEEIDVDADIEEEDLDDPRTADAADELADDAPDLPNEPPNHPMETRRHEFRPMTDETDSDSDDQDEQLTDDLRGVEDPDADNSPDALLDRDEDDDGDDGDA